MTPHIAPDWVHAKGQSSFVRVFLAQSMVCILNIICTSLQLHTKLRIVLVNNPGTFAHRLARSIDAIAYWNLSNCFTKVKTLNF
jgi:hypothetical protein